MKKTRLAQQPQTLIGLVILCGILILCLIMLVRPGAFINKKSVEVGVPPATTTASPIPGIVLDPLHASSSSATATAASNLSPASTATSAAYPTFKVKKNQSFWEFAKRYCGSHAFAEKLAQDNGYKLVTDLKEGDLITITCAQQ